MTPQAIANLVRAVAWLLVVLILYFGGRALVSGVVDVLQAPLEAELDASRGNQVAAKASIERQGAAVKGLQDEGKARQAKSAKAVEEAGKADYTAADGIKATPAPGSTAIERAVSRINQELGL